jgi:predicted membrane-bound dolichyl-phosphate-mannose-protein mannosyltransferase
METRIKYINRNGTDGHYAVQIKKWIFWKTIYTDAIFANVEKFIDTLAQIDEFNNKVNILNELVYDGYAVRNVYKTTGPSYSINFFDSSVHISKHNDGKTERTWADCNGNIIPMMEIKAKTLFGKECLEPMRVRITIEQIEE